jgi:hypothetical protein
MDYPTGYIQGMFEANNRGVISHKAVGELLR